MSFATYRPVHHIQLHLLLASALSCVMPIVPSWLNIGQGMNVYCRRTRRGLQSVGRIHPYTSGPLETDRRNLKGTLREKTNVTGGTIRESPDKVNCKLMPSGRALKSPSEHTLWLQLPSFDRSKLALTSPR